MTLVFDVADYLEGVLGVPAQSIHRGLLLDSPPDCIAVQDTPGLPPVFTHSHGVLPAREQPSFQVTVRRVKVAGYYQAGTDLINLIFQSLTLTNVEINGTQYVEITPLTSPFSLGSDQSDRMLWVCNFSTLREFVHV